MAHCVTQWSFPPVLPTDSGGQDTQCGFASGTANASEWTLVKLLQLFCLSYQNPYGPLKGPSLCCFLRSRFMRFWQSQLAESKVVPSSKGMQAAKKQRMQLATFHLELLLSWIYKVCYCVAAIHLTSTARKNGPPSGAVQAAWHSQITHAFV